LTERLATLSDRERRDWIRLIRTENVGPRAFRRLISRYGTATAALDALPDLARRGGQLIVPRTPTAAEAEGEIEALARFGGQFLAMTEPAYPAMLGHIDDAPPVIAVRGRLDLLNQPTIGVVGSRNASGSGLTMASRLSRDLGLGGWVIASGLARGIDAAAHKASLPTGTIAVLAGGQDRPYPRENERLLEAIVDQGVVIAEMPMGWEARARDFPRRNRIVSGLSLGVLVIEAAERSGSLITARLAGEQGREVFAVPGSPLDPRAGGTNALIKQGAALVTEAEDVISALSGMHRRLSSGGVEEETPPPLGSPEPSDDARGRLLALLSPAPLAMDDLVHLSRLSPGEIMVLLLELELAGRIEHHAGGRVSLI